MEYVAGDSLFANLFIILSSITITTLSNVLQSKLNDHFYKAATLKKPITYDSLHISRIIRFVSFFLNFYFVLSFRVGDVHFYFNGFYEKEK